MSNAENIVDTLKSRALLPSGPYVAEVATQPKPRAIVNRARAGVSVYFRILEGEAAGRLAPVDLFITAPQNDPRIHNDVLVLLAWCECLGVVGDGPQLVRLIELLRQAAEGKRLEFQLQRQTWNGRTELQLKAVRVLSGG